MQEEKKYQLTDETQNYYGKTLYRIQALKDFGDVKAGDKGGWVESVKIGNLLAYLKIISYLCTIKQ